MLDNMPAKILVIFVMIMLMLSYTLYNLVVNISLRICINGSFCCDNLIGMVWVIGTL